MMPYGLDMTTPPASPVANLAEVKNHISLEGEDRDDHLLEQIVEAATEYVTEQTGQQLVTATYRLTLDGFPSGNHGQAIRVPRPPLQSVASIEYVDPQGETQTLPAEAYHVNTARKPGQIVPANTWPATARQPGAVVIEYAAGYGEPADVPRLLRQAVLLMVGHLYENREATTPMQYSRAIPMGLESIVNMHHVPEALL